MAHWNKEWKVWTLACATMIAAVPTAHAHVRQRSFYQYDENDVSKGGVEAILRWTSSVTINMHQFSGCLGAGSTLSFDGSAGGCSGDTKGLVGLAIAQWLSPSLLGVGPGLTVLLDAFSEPIATASACETKTDGSADGVNNFVFTSKINTACAFSIEDYEGVIGLTRVRYALTTGRIVEADIQFNDVDYTFTNAGTNDLSNEEINFKDVAVHELGHFFGLDHAANRTSSMLFAISDGMNTAKSDDVAGLWSLYPNASSELGSLKGSVTLAGAGVFGASVQMLDARSLKIVASDMTNLDGVFEFCGLPEGNYIAFANSYRPAGLNIHEYYSGFDGFAPQDGGLCTNPGCLRMTTSVKHSFVTSGSADYGENLKVFSVAGNTANKYLNIAATSGVVSTGEITTNTSNLDLDEPRLMKFRASNLGATASGALGGSNKFRVSTDSGALEVRVAALEIYTRLNLSLSILDEATGIAPVGPASCSLTSAVVAEGRDPVYSCVDLIPGHNYVVVVTASSVSCGSVPGNASGCASSNDEVASTASPYYLIVAYDPAVSATGVTTASLDANSLGGSAYSKLPACTNFTAKLEEEKKTGCCGTLGGGGIDPGASLWLGLVMSPLTWLLLAIGFTRLRRRWHPHHA